MVEEECGVPLPLSEHSTLGNSCLLSLPSSLQLGPQNYGDNENFSVIRVYTK